VTGAGAALTRTVRIYGSKLVIHERAHVKQIERLVRNLTASLSCYSM